MNLTAITGPESTGKSSLAEGLAAHYHTVWVPEYAREYLSVLERPYDYEDIARIAQGQYSREMQLAQKANEFLFCDTDFLVCRIWSEFKFKKVDPWIEKMVREHRYDLYLLCDIDLPWEKDPLREHPDRRQELFDLYFYHMEKLDVRFEIISGQGQQRLDRAISIIDKTFKQENS